MKTEIYRQIRNAYDASPALDGVLHGRRRIQQGKHGSRSALFYSAKNRALIPVESRLEYAFCYELEADPNVTRYRTQAIALPCGSTHLYPDFLIFRSNRPAFVREVKASAFVGTQKNRATASYCQQMFLDIGIEYSLVTEVDLWSGIEQQNRFMLYNRGTSRGPTPQQLATVVRLVDSMNEGARTMREVRQQVAIAELPSYALEGALFGGLLRAPMNIPIGPQTRIELAQ